MNIADFLETAKEEILAESVAYARTILALKDDDDAVLRNHLPKILQTISADLRTAQSRTQSIEKSRGLTSGSETGADTAAETHGLLRARSGLNIDQVLAEYRALRACVLRLWSEAAPPRASALQDVTRFNEAIDQALAESVHVYAAEVDRLQQLFIGMVGHDLRAPLNAIALTTELVSRTAPSQTAKPVLILKRSTARMSTLLDSLLEYNRAHLGSGMAIRRVPLNLGLEFMEEIDLQRAALPEAVIEFSAQGDLHGEFDGFRLREALSNLVTNAVKHGVESWPVKVSLIGDDQTIRIEVQNSVDRPISDAELRQLFEPLRRGAAKQPSADRSHMGLGLFIVRQIAKAHGGEVQGHSSPGLVRFTITLPKRAPT